MALKVFQINPVDFWAAETVEQAVADFYTARGHDARVFAKPIEMLPAELAVKKLTGHDGKVVSFADELARIEAAGLKSARFPGQTRIENPEITKSE